MTDLYNEQQMKTIYLKGLKFHYVKHISEVLEIALLKQKVTNPMEFKIKRMKSEKSEE